ncbi:MAG: metallophosphoesterase [Cyanobacteria bacterium J06639_1]
MTASSAIADVSTATSITTIRIPDRCTQVALCGGPYSNFGAVEAFLAATQEIGDRFCLGDIGGFGPLPERTIALLREGNVQCLQGNYDSAIGLGERDCGCGYTDPRDREFAQISYDYTYAHVGDTSREWLRQLPALIRVEWRDRRILLCHGSPVRTNEFVWESQTDDERILKWLQAFEVDGICATHSGIPWVRWVTRSLSDKGNSLSGSSARGFWANVGVLGRPAHDRTPRVSYGLLTFPLDADIPTPELVSLAYDVEPVVAAMRSEGLPEEFCESLQTGLWTTCAEILPAVEKEPRSRFGILA